MGRPVCPIRHFVCPSTWEPITLFPRPRVLCPSRAAARGGLRFCLVGEGALRLQSPPLHELRSVHLVLLLGLRWLAPLGAHRVLLSCLEATPIHLLSVQLVPLCPELWRLVQFTWYVFSRCYVRRSSRSCLHHSGLHKDVHPCVLLLVDYPIKVAHSNLTPFWAGNRYADPI